MDIDHCNTCQHHEYIVSVIKDTTANIHDIKEDISIIKLSIVERNAFLKGIRSTLKIIIVIMTILSISLGYDNVGKVLRLLKF